MWEWEKESFNRTGIDSIRFDWYRWVWAIKIWDFLESIRKPNEYRINDTHQLADRKNQHNRLKCLPYVISASLFRSQNRTAFATYTKNVRDSQFKYSWRVQKFISRMAMMMMMMMKKWLLFFRLLRFSLGISASRVLHQKPHPSSWATIHEDKVNVYLVVM